MSYGAVMYGVVRLFCIFSSEHYGWVWQCWVRQSLSWQKPEMSGLVRMFFMRTTWSGAFWKCLVVQGSFWWDQVRLFFFHANIKVGSGPAWFGSAEMCMARSGLAIFFMRTTWFGYVVAGFFSVWQRGEWTVLVRIFV